MASFDPAKFKALQRKEWGEVATGWQQWWKTHESGGQSIINHLVESAGIKSGDRVLDIATGIGEPALTAARRVGRDGRVVATDQAPQMLAIAEARTRAEGLQNIEFLEMDARSLNYRKNRSTLSCADRVYNTFPVWALHWEEFDTC